MSYSDCLPYATPGFVAFGAGSLITGWLGDRWSRRHMMVIFFALHRPLYDLGRPGADAVATRRRAVCDRRVRRDLSSVGTAMLVSYCRPRSPRDGTERCLGVISACGPPRSLVTGLVGQYFGWRFAFVVPGWSRWRWASPSRCRWCMRIAKARSRLRRRPASPGRTCGG